MRTFHLLAAFEAEIDNDTELRICVVIPAICYMLHIHIATCILNPFSDTLKVLQFINLIRTNGACDANDLCLYVSLPQPHYLFSCTFVVYYVVEYTLHFVV